MALGKKKIKYYSLDNILKTDAQYYIIIGQRSNGKTHAVLEYAIKEHIKSGYKNQLGLVRRYSEDFKGKRGSVMFDGIVATGIIEKLTKGEWDRVYYYGGRWFLAKRDEELNKIIKADEPFCYAFSLASMEHDKSTSYPNITTVLFDEFLTRDMYLVDEFVTFCNVLSTIIRQRDNVKIFMLGNTVNKYSPYFKEMGITNIKNMNIGDIDIYKYGESDLKVVVEYSDGIKDGNKKGKASDVYFAFNNPKLSMITGGSDGHTAAWEIALYPHCPIKYSPKNIVYVYFIKWDDELLQAEIVIKDSNYFTFIHRKTTPLQDEFKDLIYSIENDPRPNHHRNMLKPANSMMKKINSFFMIDKVFYQDNEVGELVNNYLNWCLKHK